MNHNNQQPTPLATTLGADEPHPAAYKAREWIAKLSFSDLMIWKESLASCAIEDNRMAEVCLETLNRLLEGKPVSDRYVLGLAWVMKTGMKEKDNNVTGKQRRKYNSKYRDIDWPKVDWNKSSRELCTELDVPYGTICHYRWKYGHPKLGTAKTRHIDWDKVDWSKNNQQIAGELGMDINSVLIYRRRLGKPPQSGKSWQRKVTNEMIEAVDWVNTRDITIAKQWSVSRERVRQIRLVKNKPRCRLRSTINLHEDVEKWLLDNKASIEGKLAHEVSELCPINTTRENKFRVMKKVDIQFLWRRKRAHLVEVYDVNWDIPNNILTWIWNRREHWAATSRWKFGKPRAKWFLSWRLMSREDFASTPGLIAAVSAEIEKVRKVGLTPNIKALRDYGFDVV